MFKRLFWLGTGAGLGVGSSWWLTRSVRRTVAKWTPEGLVTNAGNAVRALSADVAEAVAEGRVAARDREAELRGVARGRGPLAVTADEPPGHGVTYLPPSSSPAPSSPRAVPPRRR